MPSKRAKVLSSRTIFSGRVFGVRQDRVIEPGGGPVTREMVTHNGSVVLLPVFPDGRMLLVRQYRHTVSDYPWELVAGRIDRNEAPIEAARRELLEETGYTARRLRKMFEAFPTPGFVSERMLVYTAEGLTPGVACPDADEHIVARLFTLQQLEAMMRRGRLRDAKSIAGILYYARFLRRRRSI